MFFQSIYVTSLSNSCGICVPQEMAALHKIEYSEQIKADQELHDKIASQRAEERYKRHYDMCAEVVSNVVDLSCKVAEYRELTNK